MLSSTTPRDRRLWPLLVLASAAVVFLLGALGAAPAQSATIIGKPNSSPKPNCPKNCFGIGSVTAFQVRAQGEKNPFRIRRNGHIVAWRARLANPNNQQRQFFGDLFGHSALGSGPTAQIAVLRKLKSGKFRLMRQSPVVELSSYYGDRPVITLNEPLLVRKGNIVALTVPTWLPNLVTANRIRRSTWRASRPGRKCAPRFAKDANPHRKVGADRRYGCRFNDRLLYWAYFTPSGG